MRRIPAVFAMGLVTLALAPGRVGAQQRADRPPGGGATSEAIAALLDPVIAGLGRAVGVAVYSVPRERPLYLHNADTSLLPASNMKLYTTAATLDRLGPDFQYTTSLYADGPVGRDGTLHGNLILVGRGDPTLSGRFYADSVTYVFDTFASELARSGVRRIRGSIVGDDSYFDDQRVAAGWEPGNLLWWYGARTSALSFNDNVVVIEIRPGGWVGAQPVVQFVPRTDRLEVINRVRTVSARGGRSIGIDRRPDIDGYELRGRIPISSGPVRYVVAVDDPAAFAVNVFRQRLERFGIEVMGDEVVVHDSDRLPDRPWRLMASHTSPRMEEIVRVINKRSQNFFSEQVLKTLGAVYLERGSFSAGRQVVGDVLRGLGVPAGVLWMADGSGLSRHDRTTSRTTVELLVAMRSHPAFETFYDSLLLAGSDGDPRRLDAPDAVGNVRTKTGTLRNVSALSGYVTTRDGELLAFSVITNGLGAKWRSIVLEDAVAERLAGYSAWHPPLLERDVGR